MSANAKLIRNIIIAVVAIAILGGGYYFALNWEPQSDDSSEELSSGNTELVYIVSEEIQNIASIHIKNEQTEYDIIRLGEEYTIPTLADTAVNKTRITSAFAGLARLTAAREITNALNLLDYGLDRTEKSYNITRNDGTNIAVLLGDEVPTGGEFYCMIEGGEAIYTVSSYQMSYIKNTPDDYRISAITNIEDASLIQAFALYNNSDLVMKIRLTTDEEYDSSIMASTWTMEYPWTEQTSPEKLTELLELFMDIEASGFAEDDAGIKFDYRIELSTSDTAYKFSIGGAAADDSVYLRNDETSEIYIVGAALRDAVDGLDPNDYITKLVCLANISEISSAVVRMGDKEYVMEPGNEEGMAYKINGEEVDEEYFKDKYQIALAPVFRERGDFTVSGEPYMTISYDYGNDKVVTTRYYEYDERDFVAVRNDGSTVKLLRSEIDKLKKLFEE